MDNAKSRGIYNDDLGTIARQLDFTCCWLPITRGEARYYYYCFTWVLSVDFAASFVISNQRAENSRRPI